MMSKGSFPDATASGNGVSGGSWDRSSSQAKKRKNGRRCCDMIADGTAQHGITGLKRVEHRALRDRTLDLDRQLASSVRQGSQMLREYDADHISLIVSA